MIKISWKFSETDFDNKFVITNVESGFNLLRMFKNYNSLSVENNLQFECHNLDGVLIDWKKGISEVYAWANRTIRE